MADGPPDVAHPRSDEPAPLSDEVLRMARLLALGHTDRMVARLENIDERSVRRRMAVLMKRLAATTRFHAGYEFRRFEELREKRTSSAAEREGPV